MTFTEGVSLRFMFPPLPESTLTILKQELFMNYRGTYTEARGKKKKEEEINKFKKGARTPLRFRAQAVCQSGCAHTSSDVAVNKMWGELQAPHADYCKASRPQI